jgi:hypothetical protein
MSEITVSFNEIRSIVEEKLDHAWASLESGQIKRAKMGIMQIGYAKGLIEFGLHHQQELTTVECARLHEWFDQVIEVQDAYWKQMNLVYLEGSHDHGFKPAFDARPTTGQPVAGVKPVNGRPEKPKDPAFQKRERGDTIAGTDNELNLLQMLEAPQPADCPTRDDWFNWIAEQMSARYGVQISLSTVAHYFYQQVSPRLRANGNGRA